MKSWKTSIVVQEVKLLLATLTSCIKVLAQMPAACIPTQLPDNVAGKTAEPTSWIPAILVGD